MESLSSRGCDCAPACAGFAGPAPSRRAARRPCPRPSPAPSAAGGRGLRGAGAHGAAAAEPARARRWARPRAACLYSRRRHLGGAAAALCDAFNPGRDRWPASAPTAMLPGARRAARPSQRLLARAHPLDALGGPRGPARASPDFDPRWPMRRHGRAVAAGTTAAAPPARSAGRWRVHAWRPSSRCPVRGQQGAPSLPAPLSHKSDLESMARASTHGLRRGQSIALWPRLNARGPSGPLHRQPPRTADRCVCGRAAPPAALVWPCARTRAPPPRHSPHTARTPWRPAPRRRAAPLPPSLSPVCSRNPSSLRSLTSMPRACPPGSAPRCTVHRIASRPLPYVPWQSASAVHFEGRRAPRLARTHASSSSGRREALSRRIP